jgi:hypothetical protein
VANEKHGGPRRWQFIGIGLGPWFVVIDFLGAENVYAALVMVSIWGRKRTLAKEFIKID